MANLEDFLPIFCLTADFLPWGGANLRKIFTSAREVNPIPHSVSIINVREAIQKVWNFSKTPLHFAKFETLNFCQSHY